MRTVTTEAKIVIAFFGLVLLFTSIAPVLAMTDNMTDNTMKDNMTDNMMGDNMTDNMMGDNMTSDEAMTGEMKDNMTDNMMKDNMTDNMMKDNMAKPIMSPKMQVNEGVAAKDVQCNEGLQLLFKASDGSPICVKPDTANILLQRNWATQS